MKTKYWTHEASGRVFLWPPDKSVAEKHRTPFYTDINGRCTDCGTADPFRYVKCNSCRHCVALDHKGPAAHICTGGPHLRDPDYYGRCMTCAEARKPKMTWEQIRKRVLVWPTEPCFRCGKVAPFIVQSMQCVGCLGVEAPPVETDRYRATRAGMAEYNTGKPCRRGHTASRYTSTGQCTACVRVTNTGQPLPPPVADDAPISHSGRSLARRLGFKLYDTGNACPNGHSPAVRYVSSGACRQCTADRQRLTARSAVVHADRTVNTEATT